ncbi:MAG: hypothetical protein H0V36_04860 [Chloroflexi bacterium]|nr:hypothetical protein [Chloroflexota bacterium]
MNARRLLAVAAAIVLPASALIGTAVPVAAGVGPYTFPGCGMTLQDCIDAASAGQTIHIATDTPIDEFLSISKGLRLDAAPGSEPTIDGVSVSTTGPTTNVTIDGLGVKFNITALFTTGAGHSLTVRGTEIDGTNTSGAAVDFVTQVPSALVVEGSSIRSMSGRPTYSISFSSELTSGIASLSAIGNRITQVDNDNGGSGIHVQAIGAGEVRADIMNNAIWEVARCGCGLAAAVYAFVNGTVDVDMNVVGNTLESSSRIGIALLNWADAGGSVALDVFDNIISHHPWAGIHLENESVTTLRFRAGHNDLYVTGPNRLDGESLGPGTLHVRPGFIASGNGDLRLLYTSPLIDAGQVCTPGGVANPDADGHHRLAGARVDIGAYERGAVAPTGEVQVGTSLPDALIGTDGADILCGHRGPDFLAGHGGADYLDGGRGHDTIVGGKGSDRVFGRNGSDLLCARDGVNGNDRLSGGKGNDGYDADPGDLRKAMEYRDSCPN